MLNWIMKFLFLIIAYVIGSIPWGWIIGKFHHIDIRDYGSKNIGATNTARVLGRKYFVIIYFLDALKGAIIVFLFRYNILPHEWCLLSPMLYGFAAVVGHTFPIFLNFKGGKAVSTGSGAALGYYVWPFFIALVVFLIVLAISKYVSLSSICAAFTVMISSILFSIFSDQFLLNLFSEPEIDFWPLNLWYVVFLFLIGVIILIRHKSNIQRIKTATEAKVEL